MVFPFFFKHVRAVINNNNNNNNNIIIIIITVIIILLLLLYRIEYTAVYPSYFTETWLLTALLSDIYCSYWI
jgi:uncharacterized integral membrane protein